MDELEQAHEDYEKRKSDVIFHLSIMKMLTENYVIKGWLNEAIKFIKEKEV